MPTNLLWTLLAGAFLIPLLLAAYQKLEEKRDLQRFPPPGRLLTHADRKLHFCEHGTAGPVVILESGLSASSLSWVTTAPRLAEFARVVSYDRAGLGWSEPSKSPLTLADILADLEALLRLLQLPTPFILVGHSFGALIVRCFAHYHPESVAALVLIDPVSLDTYADPHPHVHKMLKIAANLSGRGAFLARFAVVRAALWLALHGSRRLPAFIGRVSAGRGSSVLKRLAAEVSKLPSDTHAPISSHWCRPASFNLMADYLRVLPRAAQDALTMPVPPHIPMVILSAASATDAELAERDAWIQNRPRSRNTRVPNTTHWLMLDRPDLVAEAVRQLAS